MKRTTAWTAILLLGIAVGACAIDPQQFLEIELPPARLDMQKYSFVPLNENGWRVIERDDHQIGIAKYGTRPDEMFVIQGTLLKLPPYASPEAFVGIVREVSKQRY